MLDNYSSHEQTLNNGIAIGNRVKSARMLSGYTRKAFAEISKISMATLRIWEEPTSNRGGLTEKGALRLIEALNVCGIYCTKKWLLFGLGPGPNLINNPDRFKIKIEAPDVTWGEDESIIQDIESFKRNNVDPIVAIITDNSMSPKFNRGDYVGGSRVYKNAIENLIGCLCIVGLKEKTLIRRITATKKSKYTLCSINQDPIITDPVITEVEIIYAAEIVWHRWRKKSSDVIV